jgi:hypothetical protein
LLLLLLLLLIILCTVHCCPFQKHDSEKAFPSK